MFILTESTLSEAAVFSVEFVLTYQEVDFFRPANKIIMFVHTILKML